MRLKLSLMLAAALVSAAPAPAFAQYTLNVRDADIRAFIQDAARITGRTFVIDGRVNGKVSVVTDRPLSRSEYFEIFLATLRSNGLVAVPGPNGSYRVQPIDGAAAQPGRIGSSGAAQNQFVTEIIRLKHIDAVAAVETLRPLVSPQGSLTANRNANSLVVADFADNIRRIRALAASIDRDSSTSQIVTLKNAGAREIAAALTALVPAAGEGAKAPIAIVPVDSSNAIALRGDQALVARFVSMAHDLDAKAAGGTELRVYWLEHANAETLLPTLQQLVGGGSDPAQKAGLPPASSSSSTTTGGSTPAPVAATTSTPTSVSGSGGSIATRGPAIVTRYEGANAIIVAANSEVQRMLGELIRQLDSRREQVLVEAIVVEIGDDAAKRLGVQFLLGGKNIPFVATNYSNAQPNIFTLGGAYAATKLTEDKTTVDGTTVVTQTSSALGSSLQEAAAASLLSATGGFAGFAGDIGKNTIFGAIINAVKSDTTSNLLATPHIVTLDNQAAKFLVGQEVPITTGEALSDNFDNAFRTVQREEVGIKLEVTPQVNGAGEVKLFLRQEVSSVAGPVSSRNSDLILNKRSFETVLTVDDGEILAIGGLLNDDERKTIERIPLLSDIPLLGELFKSRSRSRSKTNLMVFIRPTVLRNREDNAALTARRYGYIRDFQLQRNPGEEPAIDTLVRDYLGTVPPVPSAATPTDVTVGPVNLQELRGPDGKVISTGVPPSISQAPAPPAGDYP
ncbi:MULTISPECIES: type II secretion system secretin GspD [unclassified Sphingopyxis]|uniref:type II secretion system secretin GspD n=1 Tax=unclassified Sphingopyxis TaxID=2614943 RepID=UPI0007318589|nr:MULTISPECIES: type II secretion system secretin GspD [unclassified Sphingopyxis]KTE22269.1 type II secretion system protein GspD [Sphingopyxis sp. H057]KTE49953.1 type II secretion system protein GspD [Sphingopyxis sp. H071]KTE51151.1 type II secretion system protein GspD [Sphingopyxis sp. H073]KTE59036.1 type II secretion system protein GspD [Sphingopyxis sp. H107]KTE60603.1 type II secretion system protein GspD [Sphingopyxis sp. H100]